MLRDLRSFQERYKPILNEESNDCQPLSKNLLVVSLSPVPHRIKLEIMLSKALNLRGYTPKFLTHKSQWVPNYPRKYFDLARFGTIIYREQYSDQVMEYESEIKEITRSTLTDSLSTAKLCDFTYRGSPVGQHILSSLSRTYHEGKIDITSERARIYVRRVFPEVLRTVRFAEILLSSIKPDIVLFNDTGYGNFGPICDVAVARGINTIQFTWALEDDALIFKRCSTETRNLHPNSLSPDSWSYVKRIVWTPECEQELQRYFQDMYGGRWFMSQRNQQGKTKKNRSEIQDQLGLDPDKKTVVVFSHILWDANRFFGEDLFADFGEWLVETVRAAYVNKNVNWVIKLHPGNVWKRIQDDWNGELDEVSLIRSKLGEMPGHVKLMYPDTDINTFSLFDVADYAVTVRGTIGMEMSCFGIPVLTAGTGRYSGLGFTYDSENRHEYLAKLSHVQDIPRLSTTQVGLSKRYAFGLFILRPWRFRTMQTLYMPLEQSNHPLSWNIEIKAQSPQDLIQASDLRAFAEWASVLNSVDYIDLTKNIIL